MLSSHLTSTVGGHEKVELNLVNQLFFNEFLPIEDQFKLDLMSYFNSTAEATNFGNAEEAAGRINSLIEEATNGQIKDLISSGDLGPDVLTVLTNAIYFHSQWKTTFDPEDTHSNSLVLALIFWNLIYKALNFSQISSYSQHVFNLGSS